MRTFVALFAAVAMALTAPAWAQGAGGKGGGRGGADGPGGQRPDGARGAMPAEAPASPGAIVYKQLDQLEDELRLTTPAQTAAWGAYADALQRLAEVVERARMDARMSASGQPNASKQLESIALGVQQRSVLVQAAVDQGRALYELLTPDQKAVADRRLWLPVMLLATGVVPTVASDVKR